jgi:hypothetical protein
VKHETESKFVILSETLFILLPVFIILIYDLLAKGWSGIFRSTEFSYATIVLFGQTIVKFAIGLSRSVKEKRWQIISLILSLIIIFGLIPSVIILILLLSTCHPNNWVLWAQFGYLCFALGTAGVIGTVGQLLFEGRKPNS